MLIVEDDPLNAGVLEELLSRAGFSVRAADSGAAGVKAFEEWVRSLSGWTCECRG